MKTILVGINSKYIHPNLAIRYLKANTTYPVGLLEMTIKDHPDKIMDAIINSQADVIGFSIYIWNIEIIKQLLEQLKKDCPEKTIILGGPEVSYKSENYLITQLADFIICNEGEIAFDLLLKALDKKTEDFSHIPNLIYIKDKKIHKNKVENIKDLKKLKDPYPLFEDKDMAHKIQYVELSRGCPYQCAYCLASLEKGLRFFDIDHVLNIIDRLIKKGAKTFKFLDRSFNANHALAQAFLSKLYQKQYQDISFQFEINGDVLKDDFIDFLINHTPKNLIRFEIGVQSTNDLVNKAVRRYQDTKQLIKNIEKLKQAPIVFHLDLIAGLPYEDIDSFRQTFNTIYQLFPHELQLGFLKVLKGTAIHKQSKEHQIIYQDSAPYEIIESKYISKADLKQIHQVETMLNIYWNKNFMNRSIHYLTKNEDAFMFYQNLYQFFNDHQWDTLRYHFNDLFTRLILFLKAHQRYNHTIASYLKYDFLLHHPIKPKLYWQNDIDKNRIIRAFHQKRPDLNIDELYKYALVTDYLDGYLLVVYKPKAKEVYTYKP